MVGAGWREAVDKEHSDSHIHPSLLLFEMAAGQVRWQLTMQDVAGAGRRGAEGSHQASLIGTPGLAVWPGVVHKQSAAERLLVISSLRPMCEMKGLNLYFHTQYQLNNRYALP